MCEARDPKGLYRRARAGQLAEFTGTLAPYEESVVPEVIVDSAILSMNEEMVKLLVALRPRVIIQAA